MQAGAAAWRRIADARVGARRRMLGSGRRPRQHLRALVGAGFEQLALCKVDKVAHQLRVACEKAAHHVDWNLDVRAVFCAHDVCSSLAAGCKG